MSMPKFDLEKFDGKTDFHMWKVKMEALLDHQRLGFTLDAKGVPPTDWNDEKKAEMQRRALSTLKLCLADDILRDVYEKKTALELWLALEEKFLKKSLTNRLFTKQRLYTMRLKEGGSLEQHLTDFSRICHDLRNIEKETKDEDLALLLLCSLPPSYEHFVDTLLYGRDTISLKDVKEALQSRELKKRVQEGYDEEQGQGLVVRGRVAEKGPSVRSGARSKSRGKKKALKCYLCHKEGHFKRNCPERKRMEASASVIQGGSEGEMDDTVLTVSISSTGVEWILDSACTFHMTPNRAWFSTYTSRGGKVLLGDNKALAIAGTGEVKVKMFDGVVRTLEAWHIPELKKNLISLGTLDARGYKFHAEEGQLKVLKGSLIVMRGKMSNGLYLMEGTVVDAPAESSLSVESEDATRLWHMRLGHMSEKGIQVLHKKGLLEGVKTGKLNFCEHCQFGKLCRVKFSTGTHNTKGILDYVHSDLWGPSPTPSKGGARYMMTLIDDFSRRVWVHFLKLKSEAFETFKQWKTMIENRTGGKVKTLRTDNGLEYCSKEFEEFCKKEGIVRHRTVRYTPQQNGVAERMNRTLLERARCLLSNAGLSRSFWAEAIHTAAYLVNRSPSTVLEYKSPLEVWSGSPCNYSELRIFGCPAYVHVNDGKLEPRARKCIFLGYADGVKGYRLWCSDNGNSSKFLISRDVKFDETTMLNRKSGDVVDTGKDRGVVGQVEPHLEEKEVKGDDPPPLLETQEEDEEGDMEEHDDDHVDDDTPRYSVATGRPRRQIRPPQRYGYADMVAFALTTADSVESDEPLNYKEAIRSSNSAKWVVAMEEEIQSLEKNHTWELVELPRKKRVVGCKWVYRKKEGIPGVEDERFKARLVAKGFTQKEGEDFHEVFSPVVKHKSIRVLLAMVAAQDMELEQLDVKTAFLHGELEEQIYMAQPEGFKVSGKEDHVCLLKKSLYGLKQSPRQWYKRFDAFMLRVGYSRSKYDVCVYSRVLGDGSYIYLLLYVDDMLIAAKSKCEIDGLKDQLKGEFEMKDLGAAKKILGMEISRDRREGMLYLSQKRYVEKMLERFGMVDSKPVSTPLAGHFKLSSRLSPRFADEVEDMSYIPYASAVGSLMYAMVCTRPDISHAVSVVSRFMANPGRLHWEAVKWVMRYLRGTTDLRLVYGKAGKVIGYADSDYAGDLDRRRSLTGYIFTISGCAVSWKAVLQDTVAQSTTEAEYMAATEGVREAIWMRGFVKSLGWKQEVFTVYCDNQSAVHLSKNHMYHERTKHIDVKYHFIRDVIEEGHISVEKVHTKKNPADVLTKSISTADFKRCLEAVGCRE